MATKKHHGFSQCYKNTFLIHYFLDTVSNRFNVCIIKNHLQFEN
uniref:Uncharacterized protein n=1 Tax=Arundo donax TaxID=35708 RepID=A0A0A8Z9G2_ARUDO